MAQLDRLLSVMVSNRASRLTLIENEVAQLEIGGQLRPVTKQPLPATQLLALLREIAPPDAMSAFDMGVAAAFRYSSDDGVFIARAERENDKWVATFAIDDRAEFERKTGTFRAMSGDAAPAPARRASVGTTAGAVGVHTYPPEPAPIPPGAPVGLTGNAPVFAAPAPAPASAPPPRAAAAPPGPRVTVGITSEGAAHAEMERLLRLLVERGSSDLHLRVGEAPILRISGEMMRLDGLAAMQQGDLELMLRSIMPERNRKEFADLNDTDFAYEMEGVARFRANVLRDRKGIGAVFRVIPADVVTVEQMGITQEVQNLCYLTKGLVLVTGPTGSGKSTTLCSLVDLVNRKRTDHVITIEDPIEFVHPNKNCIITQRQVGVHTTSFKHALRAALREDPDIILVGELRDLETVSIAIETAETGHLVFGTLHTTTAPSTIDRIIDQFPPDRQAQIRVMLSESLKGVIPQTLCKKIGGGRVAAREILLAVPAVSNLIREGKTFQLPSVLQTSRKIGMITMNDALIELVDGKLVEPKEAYMKAVEKTGFLALLTSHGHNVGFLEGEGMGSGAQPAQQKATPGAKPAPAKR